jgi:hypothetical protein
MAVFRDMFGRECPENATQTAPTPTPRNQCGIVNRMFDTSDSGPPMLFIEQSWGTNALMWRAVLRVVCAHSRHRQQPRGHVPQERPAR